ADIGNRPALVRSFFKHPDVAYISDLGVSCDWCFLLRSSPIGGRAAIAKRLDRIVHVIKRLERNEIVTFETMTLLVRFWMTVPSALPKRSSIGGGGSSSSGNRHAGHRRLIWYMRAASERNPTPLHETCRLRERLYLGVTHLTWSDSEREM
ncbi:hypothetical protein AAFX91_41570, partial [Bradyrhizobium sp. 31Argb]